MALLRIEDEIILNYVNEYNAKYLKHDLNWCNQAEARIKSFVNDFPIDKLKDLPMEDYLIMSQDFGKTDTFCYRINNGVGNSSMRTARPAFYGVYKN